MSTNANHDRPTFHRRVSSQTSLARDHKPKRTVHASTGGGNARPLSRNGSHGRNLHRLSRFLTAEDIAAFNEQVGSAKTLHAPLRKNASHGSLLTRTESKNGPSPAASGMKKSGSAVSLKKNSSSSTLAKHGHAQGHGKKGAAALLGRRSQSHDSKREREEKLESSATFSLEPDEEPANGEGEGDDGWTEDSASPSLTRRSSVGRAVASREGNKDSEATPKVEAVTAVDADGIERDAQLTDLVDTNVPTLPAVQTDTISGMGKTRAVVEQEQKARAQEQFATRLSELKRPEPLPPLRSDSPAPNPNSDLIVQRLISRATAHGLAVPQLSGVAAQGSTPSSRVTSGAGDLIKDDKTSQPTHSEQEVEVVAPEPSSDSLENGVSRFLNSHTSSSGHTTTHLHSAVHTPPTSSPSTSPTIHKLKSAEQAFKDEQLRRAKSSTNLGLGASAPSLTSTPRETLLLANQGKSQSNLSNKPRGKPLPMFDITPTDPHARRPGGNTQAKLNLWRSQVDMLQFSAAQQGKAKGSTTPHTEGSLTPGGSHQNIPGILLGGLGFATSEDRRRYMWDDAERELDYLRRFTSPAMMAVQRPVVAAKRKALRKERRERERDGTSLSTTPVVGMSVSPEKKHGHGHGHGHGHAHSSSVSTVKANGTSTEQHVSFGHAPSTRRSVVRFGDEGPSRKSNGTVETDSAFSTGHGHSREESFAKSPVTPTAQPSELDMLLRRLWNEGSMAAGEDE